VGTGADKKFIKETLDDETSPSFWFILKEFIKD